MGKGHDRKKYRWACGVQPMAMGSCPWPWCAAIRAVICSHLFVCSTGSGEQMKKAIAKKSNSFKGSRKVNQLMPVETIGCVVLICCVAAF